MLIPLLLSFCCLSLCGKYDVENCFKYKSLIYNAPCTECKAGFQLIKQDNYCKECKNGFLQVNGKCVVDYDYEPSQPPPPTSTQPLKNSYQAPSQPTQPSKSVFISKMEEQRRNQNNYNCKVMNLFGKCTKCKSGYQFDMNNFCQLKKADKNKNCLFYNHAKQACEQCMPGYGHDSFGFCHQQTKTTQVKEEKNQNTFFSPKMKEEIHDPCVQYEGTSCQACDEGYDMNRILNKCFKQEEQSQKQSASIAQMKFQNSFSFPFNPDNDEEIKDLGMPEEEMNATNTTNGTDNATNETDEMVEEEPEIVQYEDENCYQKDEEGTKCKECKYFHYFDQNEGKCKAVDPLCKDYDKETGNCTKCFFSFDLKDGECILID